VTVLARFIQRQGLSRGLLGRAQTLACARASATLRRVPLPEHLLQARETLRLPQGGRTGSCLVGEEQSVGREQITPETETCRPGCATGSRYSHARHFTNERPVSETEEPAVSALDELLQLGFEPITEWTLKRDKIALRTLSWPDHGGWLYVFAVNGELKYIGLTNRVLRSRMDDYRDAKHTQTTQMREAIKAELAAGHIVHIFGRKEPNSDMLATEEVRLRAKYRPPWNRC
jgi:hypothetical protein